MAEAAEGAAVAEDAEAMLRALSALVLLRAALERSPNSFQSKLSALELFGALGAPAAALPAWESLRVRYVQSNTLTFLVLPHLARCGFAEQAKELCVDTLEFHRKLKSDLARNAWLALNEANLPSVVDFAQFGAKMGRSLQLAECCAWLTHNTVVEHAAAGSAVAHAAHLQRQIVASDGSGGASGAVRAKVSWFYLPLHFVRILLTI